jgi:predicted RNA-binding Zn ribbon-like protein
MGRHIWSEHDFIAGDICLDFLNTVGDTGKTRTDNRLPDLQSLCEWAQYSGIVDSGESLQPSRAEFAKAISLRERLHGLFAGIARGESSDAAWEAVRTSVADAVAGSLLAIGEQPLLRIEGPQFSQRIALAALSLIHSGQLHRLRECARCSWLFLDQSKAQRRRWCRTEVCGNRARVERHYRKQIAGHSE